MKQELTITRKDQQIQLVNPFRNARRIYSHRLPFPSVLQSYICPLLKMKTILRLSLRHERFITEKIKTFRGVSPNTDSEDSTPDLQSIPDSGFNINEKQGFKFLFGSGFL